LKTLEALRAQLDILDRELLELAARRQSLATEIARVKIDTGQSTRDFRREREVLLQGRSRASEIGISPDLAEALLRLLIRSSLVTQERSRVAAHALGSGQRALVIGGRGKMGRWFVDFLASQGFEVSIADPAGAVEGYPFVERWQDAALDHDVIVIATPLAVTDAILGQIAARRPRGLVFDIGSLKTPLRSGLEALIAAGCRATSVHPMFGPDTDLLSGRHVIFIDLGAEGALAAAQGLFAQTMADQVVMTLDEHDRLIAYILGLSHALNIVFFTALAGSGEAAPRLAQLSSTTFDAQLDVASRVAAESPALYYEIQKLNAYGGESLSALRTAVTELCRIVANGNEAQFAELMTRGRAYLEGRSATRAPMRT
jgi:chorismate mutase / prephenate dehydrogenase